jgi:hypothetical protein
VFLKTNDRIINLKNVSNINILKDFNKDKFRMIFNMNYNIEINNNKKSKYISDYVYWDAIDKNDLEENVKYLSSNKYFVDNFIMQVNGNGFINVNEISSIKFSEKKHRVIFNLSHPVTFTDFDKVDKITSEFVYVNCDDFAQYKDYVQYIKNKIGE